LPIPSATDKDGEDEQLIYYLNKTTKSPFELITFDSNQIGKYFSCLCVRCCLFSSDFYLALNVTESLDRETKDFYELQLTVSDQGNLTTKISIRIFISDINDNVPIFDQQTPYIINISEGIRPSLTKPLIRVHATDYDSGENARIVYKFSSQTSEIIRRTFQLNPQTGDLFLINKLDYEQYKEYRIPITAQDSGPVSVPVYAVIIINIEDENDNKPLMNIRTSEYFQFVNDSLYISEETPMNTLLMHVLVEDFDSGLNGKVRCWIETSNENLKLNITNTINNMFSIYTNQKFDREHISKYNFSIIIEDSGLRNRHQTKRHLQLIITDINDSAPKFSQISYNLSLQEEHFYHQAIIQFHAHDADTDDNSRITYVLTTNQYLHLFYLNNQTGELFLKTKLDRETKSDYNLTIRAYDHGIYPSQLYTDTFCYIKILDENEYPPKFERNVYRFDQVNETSSINTSIGFIKAIDRDENPIVYSIKSNNFYINSSTGELFVRQQLDYDTNNACETFIARAQDHDGLNSTCKIEICLQPVNEYAPELDVQSRSIYINVENTTEISLVAHDRDSSPSSHITFEFGKRDFQCNLTFSSNGTIYFDPNDYCIGILDLFVTINDNDRYPTSKQTNETVRLIFYSNSFTLEQIFSRTNYKLAIEIIILAMIFFLIMIICCLVIFIVHRHRKHSLLIKSSQSKIIKTQIGFTEVCFILDFCKRHIFFSFQNHSLLTDGILDMKYKPPTNPSDTSSSYNDSCYGSSEMDVQLNGKHRLSPNEKYLVLSKDTNLDEIHSTSTSSSSPIGNNGNLVTKYQLNHRTQQYQTRFFQNDHEYKKVLGSTSTFNYRNAMPTNEYYL